MNKIISTQDRVFMAVVGPSSCGKTEFFFQNVDWKYILSKIVIMTKNLLNCHNDKEFVKLATVGRHKNISVFYIKHNLYQQSKWSPTIDLNTTHIILFKSARDIQQVEFLGKQLNLVKFLKYCYQLATKEPFGHLLIDLDPKTSECLRYSSNFTEPGPSVLYLQSDKAETTPLNNEREKIIYTEANGTFTAKTAKEKFA